VAQKRFGVFVDRKTIDVCCPGQYLLGIWACAVVIDQGVERFDCENGAIGLREMCAMLLEDFGFDFRWFVY